MTIDRLTPEEKVAIARVLSETLASIRSIPIDQVETHDATRCAGERCAIHNPSQHPLVGAVQIWRPDRQIVERVCRHGVGHPDPDDLLVRLKATSTVHGCDGCCVDSGSPDEEV